MKILVSKKKALEVLRKCQDGASGKSRSAENFNFDKWHRRTETALKKIFDNGSEPLTRFHGISYKPSENELLFSSFPGFDSVERRAFDEGMKKAYLLLDECITHIDDWIEEDEGVKSVEKSAITSTSKVFIVHGRDDGPKEKVARMLMKLGLDPIILHEKSNEGRTIIEKFEAHSDVGFAVVLLTPDDRGGLKDAAFDDMKLRARQNVIFEMGAFFGKIGRKRVACLLGKGVERPSDMHGIIYIPLSADWKLKLAKELKSAGYEINLNKL